MEEGHSWDFLLAYYGARNVGVEVQEDQELSSWNIQM